MLAFCGHLFADEGWVRAFTDLAKKRFRVKAVLKAGSFKDNITGGCDEHVQCVHRYNSLWELCLQQSSFPTAFHDTSTAVHGSALAVIKCSSGWLPSAKWRNFPQFKKDAQNR